MNQRTPERATAPRPGRRAGIRLAALAALLVAAGCASSPRTGPAKPRSFAFWPPFPDEPRLQFLASYQFSDDVEPAKSGLDDIIYGERQRVLPINKPYGVDMWKGRIYVCDTQTAAVTVLDLRKRETRMMGATGMGRLSSPTDIAIAPDGRKYVTDAARGAVFVFDANERHVASIGYPGLKPTGVALAGNELFVCDFEAQGVQVFDRMTGERLRFFGGPGSGDGQFVRPLGIDVAPDGSIYVSDVIRAVVQRFSAEGTFLSSFGGHGDAIGNLVRPKHVAVDADGVVYVVDAAFANVQMFNDRDELLMFFGSSGPHPGNMKLPAGISVHEGDLDLYGELVHPAFEAKRLVLVTNQFGSNKVAVYAMGQLREGRTVQDIATTAVSVEPSGPGAPAVPDALPALPEDAREPVPGPPGG